MSTRETYLAAQQLRFALFRSAAADLQSGVKGYGNETSALSAKGKAQLATTVAQNIDSDRGETLRGGLQVLDAFEGSNLLSPKARATLEQEITSDSL